MNVLITGFAGTLGSAFTRYFLERGDSVTGVDNSEWAVAAYSPHGNLTKLLRDFSDVSGPFGLCVHCAAYKHVDLIESNRPAAYENNVSKFGDFLDTFYGKLLFISTDKAVDPASYYGETKMEGEKIAREFGGVVARLGNISGSSGSVIPIWEAALDKGLPLPVTDPGMKRYMIPADEAVAKVMALYPHALPGDTVIPDMGPERGIMELAQQTALARPGLPVPYPVEVTGIRPGEKLRERLAWDSEETRYSDLNGIIVHG